MKSLPADRRRRSRTTSAAQPIYIVSTGGGVEQVFAHRDDAERFARENPPASVSCHQVRESVDDAVVVFDRRVIVGPLGATVLDRTETVRQFIDNPHDTPDPADVEWFQDATGSRWHIAGFGIDKALLDAKMEKAIEWVSEHGQVMPMERSR
jgi:hypothetical protein